MSTDHTNDPGEPRDTEQTRPLPLDEPMQRDVPQEPQESPSAPGWTEQPTPPWAPGAGTEDADEPQPRSGRHPLSISYLVAGLVFLGVATSWALRETGVVEAGSSSWLFPLTLVVVGAIGLAASVVSSARRP